MNLIPLCLDVDASLPLQPRVTALLSESADLRSQEDNLRLWSNKEGLARARECIADLKKRHPEPWLTFLGSGDLHHMSLLLLEALPQEARPLTLVVIDNHPDWFLDFRRHDCGDWVAGFREMPWIEQVVLIGQDSEDLDWYYFYTAPLKEISTGKIRLHPFKRRGAKVPFWWTRGGQKGASSTHWWGTSLHFETLRDEGAETLFARVASELRGRKIYLSIDKDVLNKDCAFTDWDQGSLTLDQLIYAVQILGESCPIAGADITGECAPQPVKGLRKRIDSQRLWKKPDSTPGVHARNEEVNLAILEAFLRTPGMRSSA